MEMTRPDKAELIEAAQKVQKEFAEDRGPEFVELVEQIQAAAE